MPGQSIRIQPDEFTEEQHHRLGIVTPDNWGRQWTYCMFPGGSAGTTYPEGIVLADMAVLDADVDAAAAIDTNILRADGDFANAKYLRGAKGYIDAGAGIGQEFQVIHVPNDNEVEIALIEDDAGGNKPGWETALDTTSDYQIYLPGRVRIVPTTGIVRLRGVLQEEVIVQANKDLYGWALQIGNGNILTRAANLGTINAGTQLRAQGSSNAEAGRAYGGTSGPIVGNASFSGRANAAIPAFINIVNADLSYRYPIKDEPYSRDDNGNLIL